MMLIDPEHPRVDQRELSLRAAEQYQLDRALREAKERRRAARKADSKGTNHRYLRLLVRRTPATRS